MSNSVNMNTSVMSMELLILGVRELGLALKDLRNAQKEMRCLENCQGQKIEVEYIVQNEAGDQIGLAVGPDKKVEFIVQDDQSPTVIETVNRATQAYARLKILDEVKRKGYQSVKEEKLANGSIRLVVEKWR